MKIDGHLKNEFKNKVILITGGTGSIGLGIIKQLMNFSTKTNSGFSVLKTIMYVSAFEAVSIAFKNASLNIFLVSMAL